MQTAELGRLEAVLARLMLRGVVRYAKIHLRSSQLLERARLLVEGFASEALAVEERSRVAEQLYGMRVTYGPGGLFAWEREWYQQDLPAAPAKILLGGCGSGREALALCDLGYAVAASEPVRSLYQTARERLKGRASVSCSSYEDWVKAESAAATAEPLASAPFDAVILGWGSVAHVLDDRVRERLFHKLVAVCPRGPILFSFIPDAAVSESRSPRVRGWGSAVGRAVGRRRSLSTRSAGERFLPHAGFVRCLNDKDITGLAHSLGRQVKLASRAGGAAHCTLLPP